jgi:hypothetical protein
MPRSAEVRRFTLPLVGRVGERMERSGVRETGGGRHTASYYPHPASADLPRKSAPATLPTRGRVRRGAFRIQSEKFPS